MPTTNLQSDYAIPPELAAFIDDGFLVPTFETAGDCPDFSMPGVKNGTVPLSETVSKHRANKTLTLAIPSLDYEDEDGTEFSLTLTWIHPDFNEEFCHFYDDTPEDLPLRASRRSNSMH